MAMLNSVLRELFGLLLRPFEGLPSFVSILIWSILTAIAVLLVYKRSSDQDGLGEVKRKIHASVFEIRLFNDDMRAILQAQLDIMRHNLSYIRLSFKPMIWILPPLVLIISQLHFFYGYSSLSPGQSALLKVELDQDWRQSQLLATVDSDARPPLSLSIPDGLRAETEAVWTPELNELLWKIGAEDWGSYDIELKLGSEVYTKQVSVSDRVVQISPVRPDHSLLAQIESPAEAPLPAESPIRAISIAYPDAEVWCLGLRFRSEWAWMIVYFILTMVFAFALRGPLGVNI
jgi:uncharacterized membrane protein (DUF106 family)